MKNVEIPVVCICGDKKMDAMMHHFDLFEPFKVLATVKTIEISRTSEPNGEELSGLLKVLKDGLESQGERIVAIFSPGKKDGAWKDDTVKCISDGHKWGMLEPILKAYGWPEDVQS